MVSQKTQTRCTWVGTDPLYTAYHDEEWGVPEWDDRALFEKLILDGFQAGLSWLTILKKRDNFRRAFHDFDPQRIAAYTPDDIARLMGDAGIVRNRAKIEATIGNARGWLDIMAKATAFPLSCGRLSTASPKCIVGVIFRRCRGKPLYRRPYRKP